MGNGHKQQRIHKHKQQQQQQHISVVRRRTMLPILCSRSSLKDVAVLQRWPEEDGSVPLSSTKSKEEPLSPKVGCMGQVKRSNRIAAGGPPTVPPYNYKQQHLPSSSSNITTTKTASNNNNNNNNVRSYSKLKKLFSGKNLLIIGSSSSATSASPTPPAPAAASNSATRSGISRSSNSCVCRTKVCNHPANKVGNSSWCHQGQLSFVREMDPPLPVVKKKKLAEEEEGAGDQEGGSLWKRRLSGRGVAALRTLELNQQIRLHHPKLASSSSASFHSFD